jgi:hypothetical protein
VFLDDYHVRDGNSLAARQQIARFIETQLGPSDMVGLMYPLQPAASVRFSRNHAAIRKGIEGFLGRKFNYEPRNDYEQQYANYPTEIVERIRNQVSMSALQALISRMGGLKEGRKAQVLVSEGYSNILPPQMRDANSQLPGFGNPAAGNPMAGDNDPNEARAVDRESRHGQRSARDLWGGQPQQRRALPVDPRGLSTGSSGRSEHRRQEQPRLSELTIDTFACSLGNGRRAIVNRNDLTLAMKQIVRDSSAYISSVTARRRRHRTEVPRNQGSREAARHPGARRGYWALTSRKPRACLLPSKRLRPRRWRLPSPPSPYPPVPD